MVTVGGSLQRAEGAEIAGNVVTNLSPPLSRSQAPANPSGTTPQIPDARIAPQSIWTSLWHSSSSASCFQLLAMTLTLFLHPQLDRVAQAIVSQPFMAGTIGILTVLFTPIALVVLVVTLILIPVAMVGIFLLVLAWLFGMVAIGIELGDRFTKAIHQTWAPVLSAGFGTFMLMIIVGTINTVPCIGWLTGVIIGLVGTGAAVITMFGTRPIYGPGMIASSATSTGLQ